MRGKFWKHDLGSTCRTYIMVLIVCHLLLQAVYVTPLLTYHNQCIRSIQEDRMYLFDLCSINLIKVLLISSCQLICIHQYKGRPILSRSKCSELAVMICLLMLLGGLLQRAPILLCKHLLHLQQKVLTSTGLAGLESLICILFDLNVESFKQLLMFHLI